ERARLDHALAENLQRACHRCDLVALTALEDLRLQVAVGQQLHRALQIADPAQDIAADIQPDEQHRSDQCRDPQCQHHPRGKGNRLARLPGRCVGFLAHPVDQLLHADAETDIELAGLLQDHVAIVVGVELLLANLEDAGLAFAERQQFLRSVGQRLGAGILRQQFEIRCDACLGVLEFLFDRLQRVAAVGRERGVHFGSRLMTAGDDAAELVYGARGFAGVVGGKIGGAEHGVELGLRIQHRRARGGDEAGLSGAQGVILLVVQGHDIEPLAAAEPRLLIMSSMFLTVSPSAATTFLSAPSSVISPSFANAVCWVSFIFLACSSSASALREASSAGPWLARLALWAASCRLAASRGMSCPLKSSIDLPSCPSTMAATVEITMAMPAITAKAANRLPRTPQRGRRKPRLNLRTENRLAE